MALAISAAFDSGNIDVISLNDSGQAELHIRKDAHSDFYQWFHFRLTGASGLPCTLKITNCGNSAFPGGWINYSARVSEDRENWLLAETSYADGTLTISHTPATNSAYFAYFAPYSMERHADLIADMAMNDRVTIEVLGQTLDGQDLDLVIVGEPGPDKRKCWITARQHPGETMAEWCAEGLLERLVDPADPVSTKLLQQCVFYIMPNMNPDGSRRGHLRTNAVGINLNREWAKPTMAMSPEIFLTLQKMQDTGCDFNLDMHGDEALPHNFIAGFEGTPDVTNRQLELLSRYKDTLEKISPDFQTKIGYPPAKPGEANLSMSTNALAHTFGCLAMTLEMPFKDAKENPDAVFGWSPERAKHLGRSCLDALLQVAEDLR
jgi:murein tripeptide amidase MpaA